MKAARSFGSVIPGDNNGYLQHMIACRVFGHQYRFGAQESTLRWRCDRGCGASGAKTYATAAEATKYAAAFDRSDIADLGRRAPLLGMFPLRLWRLIRQSQGR